MRPIQRAKLLKVSDPTKFFPFVFKPFLKKTRLKPVRTAHDEAVEAEKTCSFCMFPHHRRGSL